MIVVSGLKLRQLSLQLLCTQQTLCS